MVVPCRVHKKQIVHCMSIRLIGQPCFAFAATVTGLQLWLGEYASRNLIFIYIAAVLVGLMAAPIILRKLGLRP